MADPVSAQLDLYNDIVNNRMVVAKTDPTPFQIPQWYQYSQIGIRYYPLRPVGVTLPPYFSNVLLASLTLQIAIGPRAGVEALLANQATWTKQYSADGSGTGYMYGTLDLNTAQMNAAMGSFDSIDSYLEVYLSDNGVPRPVFQSPIRIISTVITPGGGAALPTPAVTYYTKAEMDALFVKFFGNPNGSTVTLPSPDGASGVIIGCNNDKSFKADLY